jgi:hypothetical protein
MAPELQLLDTLEENGMAEMAPMYLDSDQNEDGKNS